MSLVRTATSAVSVIGLLLAAAVFAGSGAERLTVREVRFRTFSDHTRVVLEMSGTPRYRARMISYPYRIVIDVPSGQAAKRVKDMEVRDGLIDRIRVNRLSAGAQIVLDLPRRADFNHFCLPPADGKPHRIVIDLAKPAAHESTAGNEEPAREKAAQEKDVARDAPDGNGHLVVIDPGHGGDKPGTISKNGLQEKVPVLKLAKLLKTELERRPGYRVILTREGDHDVVWYRRVMMARENGGEAFVSLHFDSHPDRSTRGITVYFLSLAGASDENAEAAAERENLLLEVGADSANFNDDLKSILFDVSRSNAMQRSSLFAEEVASALRKGAPIPVRKVKQANFVVLRGIVVPSILVEGGYLSNRVDASFIAKESYLRWLAAALADGVVRFLEKHPNTDAVTSTQ
jgi:N-acetylmuramoyl-L-alanine amidase